MGIEEGTPASDSGTENASDTVVKSGKAQEDESTPRAAKRIKKRTAVIVAVLLLIVAAIAGTLIGVLVGRDNDGNSTSSINKDKGDGDKDESGDDAGGSTMAPAAPELPDDEVIEYFRADVGPFPEIEIPLQPSRISTYDDDGEMKQDFEDMCRFLLNNVAERGLGNPHFADAAFGPPTFDMVPDFESDFDVPSLPVTDEGRGEGDDGDSSGGDEDGDNKDSYNTNNQEAGVDEADVAKADKNFIYSLLGKYLIVVRADTDELVAQVELPPVKAGMPPSSGGFPGVVDPETGTDATFADMIDARFPNPEPYGVGLLMVEGKLAVIAGGYGQVNYWTSPDKAPIISQHDDTLVQLYSLENLRPETDFSTINKEEVLTLVGEKYLNGGYNKAYTIGNSAVIVTNSHVNNVDSIVRPFERHGNDYWEMTDEEYMQAIIENSPATIDAYIDQLMSELEITEGQMPDIVKLGLPTDSVSDTKGYTNAQFGNGYMNFMVQISSFDMTEAPIAPDPVAEVEVANERNAQVGELNIEALVQFMSNSWTIPYATTDYLVLAAQGYSFNRNIQATEETTMLYRYNIVGTDIQPETKGSVPGTIMNKFSIDNEGRELRVATTLRNWRPFEVDGPIIIRPGRGQWGRFPVPEPLPEIVSEPDPEPASEPLSDTDIPDRRLHRRLEDPDMPVLAVEPAVDFVGLTTCDDIPDQCAERLIPACEEEALTCPDGMLFISIRSCRVYCEQAFEDTQCHPYVIDAVHGGSTCITANTLDTCVELDAAGCNIVPMESCPVRLNCGTVDPVEPEPVEFFLVADCETAATPSCPLETISEDCGRLQSLECAELYLSSECSFFCKDRRTGDVCEEYFDQVVGGLDCPIEHTKDCSVAVEQGCKVSRSDVDPCEFEVDCTDPSTGYSDIEMLTDCKAVHPECQTVEFEAACTSSMNNCDQLYYSNTTCTIYCRDSLIGSKCDDHLETVFAEDNACINSQNIEECRAFLERGTCQIESVDLCPAVFQCGRSTDPTEPPPSPLTSCPAVGEGCMDRAGVDECLRLEEEGCEEIMIEPETCSVTCFSRTTNEIFVLTDNGNSTLEIVGRVDFGKPSEDITAIMFRKTRAFVVTFLRRDPLYVIDLNDATNPFIAGELDVPGYSSYLYPITSDSNMLLSIGQHADDRGTPLGMKLTVFNVTDPTRMDLLATFHEPGQWSSAEHDDKAWRYRWEGEGKGTLIIPVSRNNQLENGDWEWFDGFSVFAVDTAAEEAITYMYDINHVLNARQCFICQSLQMRSFVIDGQIITQKGHSFVSTDLATGTPGWNLPLTSDLESSGSCCLWF